MKKYYIDFGTGVGNEYAETIEEAKKIAVENSAYTQKSIEIADAETNEEICRLPWYGVKADEEAWENESITVNFGDFGYYGRWSDDPDQQ